MGSVGWRCRCSPKNRPRQSGCNGAGRAAGGQAQQATAEQIENFKKAFSVGLEAKKYMVRF